MDKEYIQAHIDDMDWLRKDDSQTQLEGLVKNLLSEAMSKMEGTKDSISFPVNIEVKPFILGTCIEVYVNGYKIGHV